MKNIFLYSDFIFYRLLFLFSGLREAGYSSPTDIQKQSIGLALKGHDILGAAKTGSGKTLAFLVPVHLFLAMYTYGYIIKGSNNKTIRPFQLPFQYM